MDIYYFKMIIGRLINPFTLMLLLCAGSYILLLTGKKLRLAKAGIGLSLLMLYAMGTSYVGDWVIAPLEFKYVEYKQTGKPSLAYIVVLGCAHSRSGYLPSSSYLHSCSQTRLQEALRLYQLNPGAKVIFTGKGGAPGFTLAETMALIGEQVGIKKQDMIIETRPSDTIEEIGYVSQMIVDAPSALVTSAAHMSRAMLLFEQQGIDITAAPTDYLTRSQPQSFYLLYLMPSMSNLEKIDRASHEYYGLLWIYVKSFFTDE